MFADPVPRSPHVFRLRQRATGRAMATASNKSVGPMEIYWRCTGICLIIYFLLSSLLSLSLLLSALNNEWRYTGVYWDIGISFILDDSAMEITGAKMLP